VRKLVGNVSQKWQTFVYFSVQTINFVYRETSCELNLILYFVCRETKYFSIVVDLLGMFVVEHSIYIFVSLFLFHGKQ